MTRSPLVPGLIAFALLIGGGIVHGMWTHRWHALVRNDGPESRLASLPMSISEWDGVDGTLSDAERDAAGVTHYLMRTYTNRATDDVVTMTLMCGPTGPIAVHPPTACYRGAGYQQIGATRAVIIESPLDEATTSHQFAAADFSKPARPDQAQPCIYWAWSTDGKWSTPDSPRLEFSGSPVLFKLYVTFERPFGANKTGSSPAEELLKQLLPEIERRIFRSETLTTPRTADSARDYSKGTLTP